MSNRKTAAYIIFVALALVLAAIIGVAIRFNIHKPPVIDSVQASLDDTLVLDHSEIKPDTTFVIPAQYQIIYSNADRKYAVKWLYPNSSFVIGRCTLESGPTMAHFAEQGDEWQFNDSASAIDLIRQHWQQIVDDRKQPHLVAPDVQAVGYK